ncbi:hypothetical protein FNH09_36735 [Streptomyces adustus]|uniref:Uncharacterized protein n=1 Tax=Streptomyces adustus TaxID=1609272 RepID=A0A5N8VPH1_9ACTN|nr:hypothetical protein [Streptomyces adustus]MPY36576.1 hypothetical protein [Streptomyces adustus]
MLTVTRTGEHVHLVHSGSRPPDRLRRLASRLTPVRPGEAVIAVGTPFPDVDAEELCHLLAPALESSLEAHVRLLVLLMAEGASGRANEFSVAELISEQWRLDVLATAGSALVTEDGSLFSPDLPGASGGWWHFSSGASPRSVGSHLPVPGWRSAVRRMGRQNVGGYVVEPVPAGLAIRRVGPASVAAHTRLLALPPEHERPQLVLMSSDVPAAALAVVMAALPTHVRSLMRLVSLDGRPLLRTGQELADLLGSDVRLAVGAPPADGGSCWEVVPSADTAAELGMTDAEGEFWRPFARTVVCSPAGAGGERVVRVTECRMPPVLEGTTDRTAPGHTPIGRVVVTAAGLWLGPGGTSPPYAATVRPPCRDTLAVELGSPDRAFDEGLWKGLAVLLERLESDLRRRVVVHTHGDLAAKDRARLHELCARHRIGPGRDHDGARAHQGVLTGPDGGMGSGSAPRG